MAHRPIASQEITVAAGATVEIASGVSTVHALASDQQPIDIIDGAVAVWTVRSTSTGVQFARPLLVTTSLKLKNRALAAAVVHVQHEGA